jgi:hypothetical protein
MVKYTATLFICTLLATSAYSIQDGNRVLDSQGNLVLMKADNVGLQMTDQCKSFRISKNPPLMPRLKCRWS